MILFAIVAVLSFCLDHGVVYTVYLYNGPNYSNIFSRCMCGSDVTRNSEAQNICSPWGVLPGKFHLCLEPPSSVCSTITYHDYLSSVFLWQLLVGLDGRRCKHCELHSSRYSSHFGTSPGHRKQCSSTHLSPRIICDEPIPRSSRLHCRYGRPPIAQAVVLCTHTMFAQPTSLRSLHWEQLIGGTPRRRVVNR